MFYGIRNLACMADHEVIEDLLKEGLVDILFQGFKYGSGEQITTILESINHSYICKPSSF